MAQDLVDGIGKKVGTRNAREGSSERRRGSAGGTGEPGETCTPGGARPHGAVLRHIATAGSHLNQVTRAIAAIRKRYDTQLRIEDVAAEAGMSASSLHAHFKAVTRMTPLDYQKQLRLQEARRLMLTGGASAGSAGFAVGYESPSQFSREYSRLFGAPPRQDIERMQAAPVTRIAL